ncbi:hypothetical protein F9B85_04470 [Heliorestis acidaminivorans]|uniref:Uncharacterized protein n=1 Tax=Heliorestis acidaminivorans TaxID=553427 RepID=A0A6I0EW83_9FIRM|nr:hypothetical protein [Heliorestis acidaminivorans]KAB2953869.1 hypothetical protein F9B85_04470 [Heliorestis acidaminivorans]
MTKLRHDLLLLTMEVAEELRWEKEESKATKLKMEQKQKDIEQEDLKSKVMKEKLIPSEVDPILEEASGRTMENLNP